MITLKSSLWIFQIKTIWLLLLYLFLFVEISDGYSVVQKSHIKRVVLFDYSLSGGHVNSREYLRQALTKLSTKYGFQLQMTRLPTDITAEDLSTAQILILSNGDGDVLPPGDSRTAVENFVKINGKGIILIHAADAFIQNWSFLKNCAVQQYFRHAPPETQGTYYIDSGITGNLVQGINNPETRNIYNGLPRSARLREEYYSFSADPRTTVGVNVLFSLNESNTQLANPMGDHPLIWTQKVGNGIALIHTLGHNKEVFLSKDSLGLKILWNEMRYVAKDFAGCMDSNYVEYTPEATVSFLTPGDPQNPCQSVIKSDSNASSVSSGIKISIISNKIQVVASGIGECHITVLRVEGKPVFNSTVAGSGNPILISGLKRGTYITKVIQGENRVVKVISLY